MSWIAETFFRDEERAKSTLAYGSMVASAIALALTLLLVFVFAHREPATMEVVPLGGEARSSVQYSAPRPTEPRDPTNVGSPYYSPNAPVRP